MKRLIPTIVLLSLLLISCDKSKISLKNDPNLIGHYDWTYSFGENNESESHQTIPDKYGLVLKKNGNVKVYKNNELVKDGFVVDVSTNYEGENTILLKLNDKSAFLTYEGDVLQYDSYPIQNHKNIFQKQ